MEWWVYIIIAFAIGIAGWAYNKITKNISDKRRREMEDEQQKK